MIISSSDKFLKSLNLPENRFKTDAEPYLQEPRGRWLGVGDVVCPHSVQEVAQIMRACFAAGVSVVPYGGGTGLVGGQLQTEEPKPLVLSLEKMNKVRDIYPDEHTMVVDAGCILANIQQTAADHDLLFPLSLASEGSAQIGGVLAANAGGVNVLRFGNARALCLGLEVVRPDGSIWHGLSRLRKDNSGFDLRDLFIGSEGTLGIITAASLKLEPSPKDMSAAIMQVASPKAALSLLSLALSQIGAGVVAFELIHEAAYHFMDEAQIDLPRPMPSTPEWSVLIDVHAGQIGQADALLTTLFEAAFEQGLVEDGVIAQSQTQRAEFWSFREHIPEANRRIGAISSHDISVPLSQIEPFIAQAKAALVKMGPYRINCFGHVGDGNLHFNVFPPKGQSRAEFEHTRDHIKTCIHDICHALGGSVSAEHGVGRLKVSDLEKYSDPVKLEMMRAIKAALDPKGLMNPNAVLRSNP